RVRVSSDKPGAMIHHRYQWVTDLAEDHERYRAVQAGEAVHFAQRGPMQLNPPRGASLELVPGTCNYHSSGGRKQVVNISWKWKETLGTLPVTVSGDHVIQIQQIASQASTGVKPEDVKLEILPESLNCMQMFVQINDQVVEIDQRNPFFPVYI